MKPPPRDAAETQQPPPPLPSDMAAGADAMQQRLEAARSRLKRDVAPPPADEE